MVNKDWTFENVQAAHKAALLENPARHPCDPTLPFPQWYALRKLDVLQTSYEQGNTFALMSAINICATYEVIMPSWVALTYMKAFRAVVTYESKDWNEVLGKPFPKDTNLKAKRKKCKLQLNVYHKVNSLRRTDPERAIDAGLFEEAGKTYNIGKTLAEEYYYETKKILLNPPDEIKMLSYITHKFETEV